MRKSAVATVSALVFLIAGPLPAADPIPDSDLGLSRTSVFDTPVPAPYDYDGSAPAIPAMNIDEVPVIPHEIRVFEKITIGRNRCLRCHLLPEKIDMPLEEGDPTPMPANHFYRLPTADDVTAQVAGGRWVCTQCHVAQADTPPLVDNTALDD